MHKKLSTFASILTVVALFLATLCFTSCTNYITKQSSFDMQKKIAFVCSGWSPSLQKILDALKDHFTQNKMNITIEEYYGTNANDASKLRSVVEHVLSKPYDLICTCGLTSSLLTKEISLKKGIKTPVVFTAALHPIKYNIIKSAKTSGNHITGVTLTELNYDNLIQTLKQIKPNAAKIIVPFCTHESINTTAEKVSHAAQKAGIECILLPVSNIVESKERLPTVLDTHKPDTIITLHDEIGRNSMPEIAKLCSQRSITLYATHTEGIQEGAALCYAMRDEEFGSEAAKLIINVLRDGIHPSKIPLNIITDRYYPYINSKVAKEQGLEFDKKRLEQINNLTII